MGPDLNVHITVMEVYFSQNVHSEIKIQAGIQVHLIAVMPTYIR